MPTMIERPDIGFVRSDGKWIFDGDIGGGGFVGQADTLAEAFRRCEAAMNAIVEADKAQRKS